MAVSVLCLFLTITWVGWFAVCARGISWSYLTAENHVTSKQKQWRLPLTKPSIQVRLSLIFPLILVRFALDLKQIPKENDSNRHTACDFRTKIWLKSYRRAIEKLDCSSITF